MSRRRLGEGAPASLNSQPSADKEPPQPPAAAELENVHGGDSLPVVPPPPPPNKACLGLLSVCRLHLLHALCQALGLHQGWLLWQPVSRGLVLGGPGVPGGCQSITCHQAAGLCSTRARLLGLLGACQLRSAAASRRSGSCCCCPEPELSCSRPRPSHPPALPDPQDLQVMQLPADVQAAVRRAGQARAAARLHAAAPVCTAPPGCTIQPQGEPPPPPPPRPLPMCKRILLRMSLLRGRPPAYSPAPPD